MKIEEKEKIEKLIRSVEDFPEKGVVFRDITTAFKGLCDKLHSFNCDKLPSGKVTNCPQIRLH